MEGEHWAPDSGFHSGARTLPTMDEEIFEAYVEQLDAQANGKEPTGGTPSKKARGTGNSRGAEDGSDDVCPGTPYATSCVADETDMDGVGPSTSQAVESQADIREMGERVRRHRRKRTPQQQHLNKLAQQRYRERRKHRMSQMEAMVASLQERCNCMDALQRENTLLKSVNSRLRAILREQQEVISSLHRAKSPRGIGGGQLVMRDQLVQQLPEESTHLSASTQLYGQAQHSASVQQQSQSVSPSVSPVPQAGDLPFATQGMSGGQNRIGVPQSPFHSSSQPTTMSHSALQPPKSPFGAAAHIPFGRDQHSPASCSPLSTAGSFLNSSHTNRMETAQFTSDLSQEFIPRSSASGAVATDMGVYARRSHSSFPELHKATEGIFPGPGRRAQSMLVGYEQGPASLLAAVDHHSLMGVPGELPTEPQQIMVGNASDQSCVLEGSPTSVQTVLLKSSPGHASAIQTPGTYVASHVDTSGLMLELETQVQALQQILEANTIFMGGVQASDEVLHLLGKMLSSITAISVRIVRSKVPRAGDFVSSCHEMPQLELTLEEREKWEKCLVMLNLTKAQEGAILDLRSEHLTRIHKIFEDRTKLNEQARNILQASRLQPNMVSDDMTAVWAQVKHNICQEHESTVDAMHMLLFSILEPMQAALLTVEAYPGVVDVVKLANCLRALGGETSGPMDTQSSAEPQFL